MNNSAANPEASMLGLMPSACEAELQNLMYHIDQMIQAKRVEWERELQTIEARLASKERECALLRSDLGEQTKELESLRARLNDSGRSSGEQVQALHKELLALGSQHERLCRNYRKREQQLQKEASAVKNQLQAENASLNQQLADVSSEKQRLQWELAEVRAQRDSSDEKLQLMQEQSAAYAEQLEKRKRLSESAEAALKRTIELLEQQVAKAQDQLSGQATATSKLKARLAESSAECRSVAEDKERLEAELQSARKATQRVEIEASRLAMELRARESELRELHSDRARVGGGDISRSDRGCQTELTSSELGRLAGELDSLRTRVVELAQRERRTAEEADTARLEAEADADQLRRQCRELGAELESARAAATSRRDSDRAQLDGLREALAGLEAQVAGVTAQRDSQADRLTTAERRAAAAADEVERCQVELGAAVAQLEAMRAENAQLRCSAVPRRNGSSSSQDWNAERLSLLERLAAAEARADRAEAENQMLTGLIDDGDDSDTAVDAHSVVRRIDGHVTDLGRQTDLMLSQATPAWRGRLALPSQAALTSSSSVTAVTASAAAAVASTPLGPFTQYRKLAFS